MFSRLRLLFSGALLFCLMPFNLFGYEVIFTRISTSEGLSSNFVNCVAQSADGYIWVGTKNGLQRYDGYQFTQTYRSRSSERLPALPVDQILPAGNPEQLWLKMGQTIGLFNTNDYTFQKIDISKLMTLTEKYMLELFRDARGNTYLIIKDFGIFVYNAKNRAFEKNLSVLTYDEDWRPSSMKQDKEGNLWIGGIKGLGCYHIKDQKFYTSQYNPRELTALKLAKGIGFISNFSMDDKDRIFVHTWLNYKDFILYLLDLRKNKAEIISYEKEEGSIYHDFIGSTQKRGIIWGYGERTFNIFDEKTRRFLKFYNPRNSLKGIRVNHVYQVFEDRDKNIWVATDNGLYIASVLEDKVRNGNIPYFGDSDITNVKKLSANRLIFTSWGNKVSIQQYDNALGLTGLPEITKAIYKAMPVNDKNYMQVWDALEIEDDHELWMACQAGRLIRYHFLTQKSEFINAPQFGNSTTRTLCLDRYKQLWFGTQQGYLIRKKRGGDFEFITNLKNAISRIYEDKQGNLWVATDGRGLFLFDQKTGRPVKNYTQNVQGRGLSTNHISDMILLNDSILAISCSANLDLLNLKTGKIKQITAYDGLPQRVVISLQTDDRGYLWMGTIGGVCRYDPKNQVFRMYDKRDGLTDIAGNASLMNKTAKLSTGNLVFSSEKDFVIFNPEYLSKSFKPANVTITDFKLFDKYLLVDSILKEGGIHLKHDQNFISISFAALSYTQSNKLRYYYKLGGASKDWVRAENVLSANFASLSPGVYTFMVKAQNSNGVFSPEITSLTINIAPAFWQTWWFLMLILLISAIPFYIIYRLRIRRLLEVQMIREKVARDLHDDVGSTLTSINILSEMASLKLDENQSTAKDYLSRISANSSQMMESMDDIVWSIKPDNDNLIRIAARMREYTASVLEPQNIDYSFQSGEITRNIKFTMDDRRHFFLIFKEALNNISKYAAAGFVDISLNLTHTSVVLRIKDNGQGFDVNNANSGNGLTNMARRAELLKGNLKITSAAGQGTEIRLEIRMK